MSPASSKAPSRVYLDAAASMPIRPEARESLVRALETGGNASSVHGRGRKARDLIETARGQVARLVGGARERLIFTSGATEANALALLSPQAGIERLIVSAAEHDSVLENGRRSPLPIELWPVLGSGQADLEDLERRLGSGGPALVVLMLANNETGAVQPVAEVASMVHAQGGLLHVDAAQAAGRIGVDMQEVGADSLTLSAHKLGGAQGAGALLYSNAFRPQALWSGGGQELALRSGTENVPAIAAFGAAAEAAQSSLDRFAEQALWRDEAETVLADLGVVVVGRSAPRLPNISALAFPGFDQARQVMALDLEGFEVSAGAACSSGKVRRSRVLDAMGLETLSPYAIRVSGGWSTTRSDWLRFADAYCKILSRRAARATAEVV